MMPIEYNVVNFNDWIDSMNEAGAAGNAAGRSLRSLLIVLKEIKDNMESEYRKHKGRLPGSTRTSRLRKKRDKMVSEWCEQRKNKEID